MKIICPRCKWSADVPDKKVPAEGGKGTCPKCQAKFEVKREVVLNSAIVTPTPSSITQIDTEHCQLCGEEILSNAEKCKHCFRVPGEMVEKIHDKKLITKICENCNGSGQVNFQKGYFNVKETCQSCNGTGEVVDGPGSISMGRDNNESTKTKDQTFYSNNLQSSTSTLESNRTLLNNFMEILKSRNS